MYKSNIISRKPASLIATQWINVHSVKYGKQMYMVTKTYYDSTEYLLYINFIVRLVVWLKLKLQMHIIMQGEKYEHKF